MELLMTRGDDQRVETARESILRKLEIFPIVSWTMLTGLIQNIDRDDLDVLVQELLDSGQLTLIPPPRRPIRAARYHLTEYASVLQPFVAPTPADYEMYEQGYRELVREFLYYPIMTPSMLATATNSTASFTGKERAALVKQGILGIYTPPKKLRMTERYYLKRYESVLRDFLVEGGDAT